MWRKSPNSVIGGCRNRDVQHCQTAYDSLSRGRGFVRRHELREDDTSQTPGNGGGVVRVQRRETDSRPVVVRQEEWRVGAVVNRGHGRNVGRVDDRDTCGIETLRSSDEDGDVRVDRAVGGVNLKHGQRRDWERGVT